MLSEIGLTGQFQSNMVVTVNLGTQYNHPKQIGYIFSIVDLRGNPIGFNAVQLELLCYFPCKNTVSALQLKWKPVKPDQKVKEVYLVETQENQDGLICPFFNFIFLTSIISLQKKRKRYSY